MVFIECLAIIALLLSITFIYFRTGRRRFGLSVLPLGIVPLFHIIAYFTAKPISRLLHIQTATVVAITDIIGIAVCAALVGAMSAYYKGKAKTVYFLITGVFSIILTSVLIINL